MAPVALEEFFSFLRAPGPSGIVRKISRRKRLPHIEDRTDDAPSGLDHVGALEQRLVADHAIVEQALVARGGLCAEVVGVLEIHVHCAKTHHWTGNFGGELEGDSFLRLDVQHELIGHQIFDGRVAEKNKRRAAELDDYMCVLCWKTLARAQVKRNIGPTPIVDCQLHGTEGLGVCIWRDTALCAIRWNSFRVDDSGSVLPADR